jgi:hypothetical protein
MSVSHKLANVRMQRLMLYDRPLHPELFDLQARRTDRHGDYEVEAWLTCGGHVVRFAVESDVLAEIVIDDSDHLPEVGLIAAVPCLGEKEYEHDPKGRIGYVITLQTEALTDNLYMVTLREMEDFALETGSIRHQWKDDAGTTCLSVLSTQKYRNEFHIQSYHLDGGSTTVLRTQSIFEIVG